MSLCPEIYSGYRDFSYLRIASILEFLATNNTNI